MLGILLVTKTLNGEWYVVIKAYRDFVYYHISYTESSDYDTPIIISQLA